MTETTPPTELEGWPVVWRLNRATGGYTGMAGGHWYTAKRVYSAMDKVEVWRITPLEGGNRVWFYP